MIKINNVNYKPIEVAIMIASVISDKDLSAIYKIAKKKYGNSRKNKHKKEITIKRRNTKLETESGHIKQVINVLNTAKDIKTNGNLLITDGEELKDAITNSEEFLSTFFGRKFVI